MPRVQERGEQAYCAYCNQPILLEDSFFVAAPDVFLHINNSIPSCNEAYHADLEAAMR